jgi:signal transduction histidine kinase
MYAPVVPQPDAGAGTRGYVERVQGIAARFGRVTTWFRELNPWALDAVIGTCFTVLGLVAIFTATDPTNRYRDPDAVAALLSLVCTLPFFVRRRLPLTSIFLSTVGTTLLLTLNYEVSVQTQMMLVAAFSIGSHADGLRRLAGIASLEVGVIVTAAVGSAEGTTADILLAGATYAAAFFLGVATQNRRLYEQQLDQRADAFEREREEEAKRAVADERLRIAQELHDVVAHSMGVIAVQAGVGAHVIDTDPQEAKQSLEAISATSRGTLTEIRRLLGVLRADEAGGYQPAPGLGDLTRLVAEVESTGLPVAVRFDGAPGNLPPGVDLTAYRIVQEALTNVMKHAGPAHATVTIGYEPEAVRLEVVDDGRGVNGSASGGGHGLLGMRERVAVYGGTLETGPVTGGGYRVAARLPYGAPE